jgi:hypothetical protein
MRQHARLRIDLQGEIGCCHILHTQIAIDYTIVFGIHPRLIPANNAFLVTEWGHPGIEESEISFID